jgi:hypothetical protein
MTSRSLLRTKVQPVHLDFTPIPRRYRHDGWTPERQRGFIAALAEIGSVKHAAQRIGMSTDGAYQLRRQKGADSFAAAWLAALDQGVQRLEDIALERAIHGIEVPVYSYGKLVGTRRVFNDRLLMFLLRNRAHDRYPEGAIRGASRPVDIEALKLEWRREQMLPGGEIDLEVKEFVKEIEQLRAEQEAREEANRRNPRGRITIEGDDREAFDRWRVEQGLALFADLPDTL